MLVGLRIVRLGGLALILLQSAWQDNSNNKGCQDLGGDSEYSALYSFLLLSGHEKNYVAIVQECQGVSSFTS